MTDQVPGETLFPIEEAINRGTIVMNLLSDAAQSQTWSKIAPLITKGKTLYFSHGFSVVYKDDTHVIPPKDVDVILVAPKGSGRTVRTLFKEGRGINSSIAVWQDVTGKAKEKAVALGVAVGSGYLYETTFEKEVYSDLYGERGVVSETFLKNGNFTYCLTAHGCHPRTFLGPIQGSQGKWPLPVGSLQRDRRGGYSISLPLDWSIRVCIASNF